MDILNILPNNPIKILNIHENKWKFFFPEEYYDENLFGTFEKAVELVDINDKTAEKKLKEFIRKHPYHIDAYNHLSLAFRNQCKYIESFIFAEKSFNLAKEVIPHYFNTETDEIEWGYLDNRPFLRACHIYAMELCYNEDYESAINLYKLILTLNKSDNQGVRYLLLDLYLETAKYTNAKNLIKKFSNDNSIEFVYGKVLLNILQDKVDSDFKNINSAISVNSFLYEELLKPESNRFQNLKSIEKEIDKLSIPTGSIYEAYEYWLRNKNIYNLDKVKKYFIKKKSRITIKKDTQKRYLLLINNRGTFILLQSFHKLHSVSNLHHTIGIGMF